MPDLSPILAPNGEPVFAAGGQDAHAVHVHGEWVVSLEWAKSRSSNRKFVRCLCIWPASTLQIPGAPKPGIWTVSESAIVEMLAVNKDGKASGTFTPLAEEQVKRALPLLARDANDRQAVRSLLDVLMRFGPDLLVIPYAPKKVRQRLQGGPMWDIEARAKATGKVIRESSV